MAGGVKGQVAVNQVAVDRAAAAARQMTMASEAAPTARRVAVAMAEAFSGQSPVRQAQVLVQLAQAR